MFRKAELLEAEERLLYLISGNHAETRGWVRDQTDRVEEINGRLDALCHYLGIKMEKCDEPYWKIRSLGGKDE